jgi:uncharacterized membrane protein
MTEASDTTAVPQTLVGVSFDTVFRAQEFLLAVRGLAAAGRLKLVDVVMVLKDDSGKAHVHETTDAGPARSALSGAMWTGLLGLLLGGPIGWAAGLAVGAGAGAVRAKIVDIGIPDEWVEWFRQAVQPGTATVALLVEDLDRDALVEEATRFTGADLLYANLDASTLARLHDAFGDHEDTTVPAEPSDAPPS